MCSVARIVLAHETFLPAADAALQAAKGTWVYEAARAGRLSKLGVTDQDYVEWMRGLLSYLKSRLGLSRPLRVLDLGCGTGELTVLMRRLGADAMGADVHDEHLELARMLARDNGLPEGMFVRSSPRTLPFPDAHFDVVHLHVVVEHLSDSVLRSLLPEIRRVCAGLVHVVVPNRLQWTDDHTGLPLLPLLPRRVATWWLDRKGVRYPLSADGTWDVYYRSFRTLRKIFDTGGFLTERVPDAYVFPNPSDPAQLPLHRYTEIGTTPLKRIGWAVLGWSIRLLSVGTPDWGLLPYLNLVLVPAEGSGPSRTT